MTGLLVLFIAGKTIETIWGYYNIKKFNWSEQEIGYSLAFVGVLISIVQGGSIRWAIPKFGQKGSILLAHFVYDWLDLFFFFCIQQLDATELFDTVLFGRIKRTFHSRNYLESSTGK